MANPRWRRETIADGTAASRPGSRPRDTVPASDSWPGDTRRFATWIQSLSPDDLSAPIHAALAEAILDGLCTEDLPLLDRQMRRRELADDGPWDSAGVAHVQGLVAWAHDPLPWAAAYSMHRRGQVRELAVRILQEFDDHRVVRWLVLRCGDWVPEVREVAWAAVDARLTAHFAAEFVDVIPILQSERFSAVRPAHELRAQIEQLLATPAARPALEEGAVSPLRSVRRACVRLIADLGFDELLLERVADTGDSVATAILADSVPASGPRNRQVAGVLIMSPIAQLQAEGLWRFAHDDAPRTDELVRFSLFDSVTAVRKVAQRWMIDRGHDPGALYRSKLEDDPLIALLGLGDRPLAADAAVARGFLEDERSAVRVAALRVLGGVAIRSDGPLFVDRFVHGIAAERWSALAGLRSLGVSNHLESLWTTAEASGGLPPIRRVVRHVLPLANRWQRIAAGAYAAASVDDAISDLGVAALRHVLNDWNRGYPGHPDDADVLRRRLDAARRRRGMSSGGNDLIDVLEGLLPR